MSSAAATLDRAARRRARIFGTTRSYGLSVGIIVAILVIWQFVLPESAGVRVAPAFGHPAGDVVEPS